MLVFIPNDLRYIENEIILAAAICARGFLISVILITWFLTKRSLPERTYGMLVSTLLASVAFVNTFIELTRPRDSMYSGIPIIVFISYVFFILPASVRIKILSALALSALEIAIMVFWKTGSVPEIKTIVAGIMGLDILGVYNAFVVDRLRKIEREYVTGADDDARFNQAFAGTAMPAVVVYHDEGLVDWNGKFADLARQCGIPEEHLAHIRIGDIVSVDAEDADSFKRGDPVQAHLAGSEGTIPVEIRKRYFYEENRMYHATLIRDRREETFAECGKTDGEKVEKNIRELPLSKREKNIVRAIVSGKSVYRIADDLDVSDAALEKQIQSIVRKTGISTKTDLFRIVMS